MQTTRRGFVFGAGAAFFLPALLSGGCSAGNPLRLADGTVVRPGMMIRGPFTVSGSSGMTLHAMQAEAFAPMELEVLDGLLVARFEDGRLVGDALWSGKVDGVDPSTLTPDRILVPPGVPVYFYVVDGHEISFADLHAADGLTVGEVRSRYHGDVVIITREPGAQQRTVLLPGVDEHRVIQPTDVIFVRPDPPV